ncbi:MAG: endolytic transglycosylase MltG [Anaerolineae bacterium]|nr:endolytic transglycosylase MltG [Anaerolineae bacterium]MDW8299677.1 endolytic transglycosylase MltG [Anaerolineae bacterium]
MRKLAGLILALGALTWLSIVVLVLRDLSAGDASLVQPTALVMRRSATPIPLIAPPTETATPTATPSLTPTDLPSITPNYILVTVTPRLELSSAPTPTQTSDSAACIPPEGWQPYRVQAGDTLFGFVLGSDGALTVQAIRQANCLTSDLLRIGQILYLPPNVGEKAPKLDDPSGDTANVPRLPRCPCQITIRAGTRLEQIAEQLDKLPLSFSGRDFLAVTAAGAALPDYWFLRSKPVDKSLEGYMLSGTYTITPEMTAAQFRDLVLANFAANVSETYESMANARGLTFWQALTLASIVQRESWDANDQRMVAGVFHNRLAAGQPLGATVTMMYALGRAGQWWYPAGKIDFNQAHPYNTLRNRGLPPSPICSPSLSVLAATLDPAQHDYYYFNIRCDGKGNFYARTYAEFKAGLQCK